MRILAIMAVCAAACPAAARATEIGLDFDKRRPGAVAGMTLHIAYTKDGDAQAKPSPIRHIRIDAPTGTAFGSSTVPACTATDDELRMQGPGACAQDSRIGEGPIVVVTGFGSPFDPISSPTTVFNDGRGWLEVSQDSSRSVTLAVTRLAVTGSRIEGDVAPAPGGPPDGETAVSTVDLAFPRATGYLTTPPRCPRSRRWKTVGTFTFADGTTQVVRDRTPCKRRGRPSD